MEFQNQQSSTSAESRPGGSNEEVHSREVARMWNLPKLVRELGTREQCVAFAEDHGLIKKEKICTYHRVPMRIYYSNNNTVGAFACYKGKCKGKNRVARSIGTFFENAKICLPTIFYLVYCYAHKWPMDKVIWEDGTRMDGQCLTPVTITNWYGYCQEAVEKYQSAEREDQEVAGNNKKDPFLEVIKAIKYTYKT
ncbi:unnamed protein product [Colias eurytheme]|nr:unnamed protein product [Colias eurytheme]